MTQAMVFDSPYGLLGKEGLKLPPSDWLTIDQKRIDDFGRVSGDMQWIHVDPVRARDGPFGTTVAHGYLTLSLVGMFLPQMINTRGISAGVNVGADRLRFLSPVPVGSRLRGTGEIISVEEIKGGIQIRIRVSIEIEGQSKPACILDFITRLFPE